MIPSACLIEEEWLPAIPRSELRATVERATAESAAGIRRAAELAAIRAGADRERSAAIGAAVMEIAIATQMLADLATVTDAPGGDSTRDDIWRLRPTWAWVWTSEAVDPASWTRGVRWVQQVAARRSDPVPVARFLAQFAARRGRVEAQARLDRARDALHRIQSQSAPVGAST